MKKSNLILIITSIITLISTGCKKDAIDKYADVYLAGYKQDISGKTSAAYWKNNTIKILDNSAGGSYANSIYVSGNDIYVSGNIDNGSNVKAVYWKNNTPFELTGNNSYADATVWVHRVI